MHPIRLPFRPLPTTILVSLVLLVYGCTPDDSDDELALAPESLYFEPVGFGQAGTIQDTTEIVIRDSVAWGNMTGTLRAREPFRRVDFSQNMVLLAALPQTSGGFRIEFESVEKEGDEITASYVVYAPGSDCLTISALTIPYQVVAVRRAAGDVSFRRTVRLESCQVE